MDNKTKIPSKAPPELLTDRFGRRLNYLRVSVTDRCNQRCAYCAPYSEKFKNREDILSFDEITRLVSLMVSMGVEKVRLTGGEPLVRKDVTDLVSMLKDAGVKDLSMTTNAVLLERFAEALALSGLNRINVSLDSLNPEKFKAISENYKIFEKELALRYVLSQNEITSVIVGAETVPQVKENIEIASRDSLPENILKEIESNFVDIPDKLINPALWN